MWKYCQIIVKILSNHCPIIVTISSNYCQLTINWHAIVKLWSNYCQLTIILAQMTIQSTNDDNQNQGSIPVNLSGIMSDLLPNKICVSKSNFLLIPELKLNVRGPGIFQPSLWENPARSTSTTHAKVIGLLILSRNWLCSETRQEDKIPQLQSIKTRILSWDKFPANISTCPTHRRPKKEILICNANWTNRWPV